MEFKLDSKGKQKVVVGLISAAASFMIAEAVQHQVNKLRAEAGIPKVHHYQIGSLMFSAGALKPDHELSAVAIGSGGALMLHDWTDAVRDIIRPFRGLPHPFNKYKVGSLSDDVQITSYQVSDKNLKKRYEQIADILSYWVKQQRKEPKVMQWARNVIKKDKSIRDTRDPVECGRALAYWINGYPNRIPGILYVRDPRGRGFDMFQTPTRTLTWRTGDCDCLALLHATGLQSVGHQSGFYLISQNPQKPNHYTHILPAIIDKSGGWIPAELTRKRPIGYMPRAVKVGRIAIKD